MNGFSVADEIEKYKKLLDDGAITQEEFNKKKEELLSNAPVYTGSTSSSAIDARTTSILCYLTWIGFIIAICLGDRDGAKFHLNQALVLNLFALLSFIPLLGWIWAIVVFVFWVIAFIGACAGEERAVPLLGGIKII